MSINWEETKLWRVITREEGKLLMETSDQNEAIAFVWGTDHFLQQLWTRTEREWRTV